MILATYEFGHELLLAIICIVVVYGVLYLLTLAIKPLRYLKDKPKPIADEDEILPEEPAKAFGIEDITDEDMMVAALVAAIDYRETTHTDVVVKSIKEIK
jgi:hypothetical protein